MTARVTKVTNAVEKKGYSSGKTPASQITVPKDAQGPAAGAPSVPKDDNTGKSNSSSQQS